MTSILQMQRIWQFVDYIEDIYKIYRLMEASSPVPDYMGKQLDTNDRMQSILV